jgi:ABC-type multidrug transport system fused ATPase/permease subunit
VNLPDTTSIALTLLGVTIPFFIFAITLLGNAIERAKQEEKEAKEQQQKDFELKINDLENKITALKESGDPTQLEKQLKEFKATQKKHSRNIKGIKRKYGKLSFRNSILIPSSLFIISILFSDISKFSTISTKLSIIFRLSAFISLGLGIYAICISLLLVQKISASSDELQQRKMSEAFKAALIAFEKEKEVTLSIKFVNVSFPLHCKKNTDITIDYRLSVVKGEIARKAETWFYIPDGFILIDPDENQAWRQGEDFVVPNIRTVRRKHGDIRKGIYSPSWIKFRTPDVPGEYYLMYFATADGCEHRREKISIVVE